MIYTNVEQIKIGCFCEMFDWSFIIFFGKYMYYYVARIISEWSEASTSFFFPILLASISLTKNLYILLS